MPPAAQPWRLALFALCAVTLLLAAILFSGATGPDPRVATASSLSTGQPRLSRAGPATGTELRLAARRFLAGFFRYEAGEAGRNVRRALRATATPAFADELLAAPPTVIGGRLPPARLGRLHITAIPALPPRALISGEARRRGRREQFSFLFDLRRHAWLARGLGE